MKYDWWVFWDSPHQNLSSVEDLLSLWLSCLTRNRWSGMYERLWHSTLLSQTQVMKQNVEKERSRLTSLCTFFLTGTWKLKCGFCQSIHFLCAKWGMAAVTAQHQYGLLGWFFNLPQSEEKEMGIACGAGCNCDWQRPESHSASAGVWVDKKTGVNEPLWRKQRLSLLHAASSWNGRRLMKLKVWDYSRHDEQERIKEARCDTTSSCGQTIPLLYPVHR